MLFAMRAKPGEYECLRIAAKAEDRLKAAEQLWPAFEKRLMALGYDPLGISHTFALLAGGGTVTEALDELERHGRCGTPKSRRRALVR